MDSKKKVFVSGCYDLLHSGHVEFFRQAAQYGDLYVGIGSDETILHYKKHKTVYSEQERLFMVKSIRYVKDAFINQGHGVMDFLPTLDIVKPDILVVNSDGGSEEKRRVCEERGMEYVVLQRDPHEGLAARSSTELKKSPCQLPTRTRNIIKSIWPYQLPNMDPETLARLVFCFENHPEREDGIISGAQDAIGICVPGLCRHYYDNHFWPLRIETCEDEAVLQWLESHLCMIPMEPRRHGCSVVEGKDITKPKVEALAAAAASCWDAILARNLDDFAATYRASFDAQVAMFPAMIQGTVQQYIDRYSAMPDVLAWKMPGAGGGGYLALVVTDTAEFLEKHPEAIALKIRRSGM